MKNICISIVLILSVTFLQASQPYDQAHEKLKEYFKQAINEEQRVKDVRTTALVRAAAKLQNGISRKELKEVRNNLSCNLLPNGANGPILASMCSITDNHSRTFPFCCKPWVYQSTINREAENLKNVIDATLKKENPETYESLMHNKSITAPIGYTVAYPILQAPSAPPLQQSLLQQYSQNKK